MSDFNIKSFFKNRFNSNNSLINNVKTGNPWTPWTNQKPVKTEEKDEAVELEDDALKFIDLFNGNSFFDAQIPEKDLKPVPNEENNDTAKSDNGQKDTPDRSEELLKGPKISDTIDTIGNWRDWIKPALPADHVAWGNGQKDEINGDLRDEIPEKGLKPLPAEENNDTAKSDNKQKVTPGWLEKLLNGPKVSDRNLNNEYQIPEKGLKPLPAEENNDTAKSDNKQKVTPGWLEKLLNGPKVSDRNLNNDIQLR